MLQSYIVNLVGEALHDDFKTQPCGSHSVTVYYTRVPFIIRTTETDLLKSSS